MDDASFILNRLILVGGPPRSGTTLIASILNQHPHCITAIDNTVYESWALYYYRLRIGLVQELRGRRLTSEEVQHRLMRHLIQNGGLYGVATSPKVASYPLADQLFIPNPDETNQPATLVPPVPRGRPWWKRWYRRHFRTSKTKRHLVRHCIPLSVLEKGFYLALKSPEISFVLLELAESLPDAKFVIVYRSLLEIAESMYRKGSEWSVPSYHKRWIHEFDEHGRLAPPPGVPEEWHPDWRSATDFQRCVLYAASYLRALAVNVPKLPPDRIFLYHHHDLCENASTVLSGLAEFLSLDRTGFQRAITTIRKDLPVIHAKLAEEYKKIESSLGVQTWWDRVSALDRWQQPNQS